mmetsp:Transcript_34598/g.86942  ORF Transcript_34598/g.86942 Transcript_34598/m.86942 type:complete len:595 (-) Transcript_34598:1202-2986(-)
MEDASLLLVEEGDKPYVPPILQSDVAPCECTAPRLSMVVIMATAVAQSFAIAGLTATMALYLSDWLGFSEDNATIGVSLFNVLYTVLAPLAGVLSDIWFGNYLCQFWSGWLWALGSVLVLLTTIPAVVGGSFGDPTTAALILCVCGLVLVALGYAVINVIQSVFVGDQYLEHESKELASSFSSYYMFANVGNLLGESICPILRQDTTYATLMGAICLSTVFSSFLFWVGTPTYRRTANNSHQLCCTGVNSRGYTTLSSVEDSPDDELLEKEGTEEEEEEAEEAEERERNALDPVTDHTERLSDAEDRESVRDELCDREGLLDVEPGSDAFEEEAPSKPVWKIGSWVIAADARSQKALLNIILAFFPLPLFWALYYQQSTTWVFQSNMLARGVFGWEIPPDIVPALNDILVVVLVPLFDLVIYPLFAVCGRPLRPIQRLAAGMLFMVFGFLLSSVLEFVMETSPTMLSLAWQIPQYICISVAEVMVAVTGLEFAYSQSPPALRGMVTSIWYLAQAGGNFLVAVIAALDLRSQTLQFLAYALMMFVVLVLFVALTWSFEYYSDPEPADLVEVYDEPDDDVQESSDLHTEGHTQKTH